MKSLTRGFIAGCCRSIIGAFLHLNPGWEKAPGFPGLIGQLFPDFVHPEDPGSTLAAMFTAREEDKVINSLPCRPWRLRKTGSAPPGAHDQGGCGQYQGEALRELSFELEKEGKVGDPPGVRRRTGDWKGSLDC